MYVVQSTHLKIFKNNNVLEYKGLRNYSRLKKKKINNIMQYIILDILYYKNIIRIIGKS